MEPFVVGFIRGVAPYFMISLIDPRNKNIVTEFYIEVKSNDGIPSNAQRLKQKQNPNFYIVIRGNPRFYELWRGRPLNSGNMV